jgi:hypothetical protein
MLFEESCCQAARTAQKLEQICSRFVINFHTELVKRNTTIANMFNEIT